MAPPRASAPRLSYVRPGAVSAAQREDYRNRVLSCTAAQGRPATIEAFYDLRDQIFVERRARILQRHAEERAFFLAHVHTDAP